MSEYFHGYSLGQHKRRNRKDDCGYCAEGRGKWNMIAKMWWFLIIDFKVNVMTLCCQDNLPGTGKETIYDI